MNFKIWLESSYDFSSTQVQLPKSIASKIINFGKSIPDKDLAEDGRENDIHITVKYGLHSKNPEEVRKVVEGYGPITATLKNVSIFPSNDKRKSDVVKIDVESKDLHDLNSFIRKNLKCTDTYPTYNPHITIAYVKPGVGKKYEGKNIFDGVKLKFDTVVFSNKDGKKHQINL